MDEETIHILQFMGALLPAAALLGLLVYARCKHAGVPRRQTITTIASVCGALLGAGAAVMVARRQLDAALLDVTLGSGDGVMPGADIRTIDWTRPQIIVVGIAVVIVIALWITAIRSVRSLPTPDFASQHELDTLEQIEAMAAEDTDDQGSPEGDADAPADTDAPDVDDAEQP